MGIITYLLVHKKWLVGTRTAYLPLTSLKSFIVILNNWQRCLFVVVIMIIFKSYVISLDLYPAHDISHDRHEQVVIMSDQPQQLLLHWSD